MTKKLMFLDLHYVLNYHFPALILQFGMQQLSVMATMGDAEKTRAFFDAHVKRDPNERVECDGSTPLILAADNKHVETVKVLLEHGADVTLTNKVRMVSCFW